jgi:hypothetical protein|tara:strand:- start:754 stop:972 length:219 start_codon:yes stop_codon:yes gene_type:complete
MTTFKRRIPGVGLQEVRTFNNKSFYFVKRYEKFDTSYVRDRAILFKDGFKVRLLRKSSGEAILYSYPRAKMR